ncbi:MAG TPA: UDP-glucose--hexose-1-phosphate uridylyltransferase [Candidatus Baltobacteraceae bacterium]
MNERDWRAWPHRRRNPLTGDWVLVSPQRTQRPWQGEIESNAAVNVSHYDPACYLCPGNERANGTRNPQYRDAFVFTNDYPALVPRATTAHAEHPLLDARSESGTCRVICFTPRHDLSIATMGIEAIRGVVDLWREQSIELRADGAVSVQIFENHGAMMGASNPHPHAQLWANATVPNELDKETRMQHAYLQEHDACLLCDYVALEIERGERLVYANDAFAVIVPFWAAWPFETILVSRTHRSDLASLRFAERAALADAMETVVRRYEGLFNAPFPYSMGVHQQPFDGVEHTEWHVHAHYYPPLLRSAAIRKFMVGYELLAQPQRDLTPEEAAATLGGRPSTGSG